ncbi:translation initiation factor IF-2 N-terminal domain-containing protein [Lactococcus lactis]|uniref:Translation initiation factor 2 n=2 Tax=Lactococcus lactis TaxID=1358 RepID=A0A5M9QDC3_LACLH|nr:translation initiation factor IF-2 N-terminal domain-containing protein [Lactococcus lactis]KAA8704995.1 translation initiation factor 2 [Lactococcus lactis subsp. hordniae]MCT3134221.1 translation initiation factor 2 [Lactococcus lactis]
MSKIKIYELADKLRVERKVLLSKAQEFGISAKSTSKSLSDAEVLKLENFYKKSDTQEVVGEEESEVETIDVPKKKESKFSLLAARKPEKNKPKMLRKLPNETPPKLKRISAKQVGALVVGGVGFLILSNVGLFGLMASGYRPTQKIIYQEVSATQKSSGNGLDLQAKNYLDGFVQTYFTFPEDEKDQEQAVKDINAYFVQNLPVISQGIQRTPSKFEGAVMMSLTDNEATYSVGEVTTKEVKKGKDTTKQNVVKYHDETTLFTIPYQKVGSAYYISDEPYFSSVPDLQANENQVPTKTWSGTDNNSASIKKDLDKFTKSLFTAYTTDGDTLKLISKGLSLNKGQEFKSLDQATYESKGDNKYHAVVQVTMKNALGTHVENYQFTIEKQKQSYFATDFKHTLPEGKKE